MKLEIIKANYSVAKAKATIHKTGRLGFNIEAIKLMKMKSGDSFHVAKDGDDASKYYLVPAKPDEGAGKIAKAGTYFYLNTGDAFDIVGFNYKEETIMFDISKSEYEGDTIYVLDKRKPISRKKLQEKEED